MAEKRNRRTKVEILKSKIAPEFQHLLDDPAKATLIAQMWKLDDQAIRVFWDGIPSDIQPLFRAKLEGKTSRRGARSLIPYSREDISKAGKLMGMKVGAVVADVSGNEYSLNSVQVLIKVRSGNKNATLSLSKVQL